MQALWRREKRIFYHRRHRERTRYTPYVCGATRFAIPCYIVTCESGGDYGAVNPSSGARGAYQMLPSTYAMYCTACDWSERDQDHAAFDLYRSAGASPWVCG